MTTPSLPDTQERYPPQDLIDQWVAAWSADIGSDEPIAEVIARKACDWKEQQAVDACMAYERESIWGADNSYHWTEIRDDLVDAIRTPPQPGAAQ